MNCQNWGSPPWVAECCRKAAPHFQICTSNLKCLSTCKGYCVPDAAGRTYKCSRFQFQVLRNVSCAGLDRPQTAPCQSLEAEEASFGLRTYEASITMSRMFSRVELHAVKRQNDSWDGQGFWTCHASRSYAEQRRSGECFAVDHLGSSIDGGGAVQTFVSPKQPSHVSNLQAVRYL